MDIPNANQDAYEVEREICEGYGQGAVQQTATSIVRRHLAQQVNEATLEHAPNTESITEVEYWSDSLIAKLPTPRIRFVDAAQQTVQPSKVDLMRAFHCLMRIQNPPPDSISVWVTLLIEGNSPFERDLNARFDRLSSRSTIPPTVIDTPVTVVQSLAQMLDAQLPAPHDILPVVIGNKTSPGIRADDRTFRNWYSDPNNVENAFKLFNYLAQVFFRCIIKPDDTVYNHIQFRSYHQMRELSEIQKPEVFWTVSKAAVKSMSELVNSDTSLVRGCLKFCLFNYRLLTSSGALTKAKAFFEYAFEVPFKFAGLHLHKVIDKMISEYKLKFDERKLREVIVQSGLQEVIDQLDNYLQTKYTAWFYEHNPKIEDPDRRARPETFTFWKYCRMFEGRCFLEASIVRNRQIIAYTIGLLSDDSAGALNMYQMKNQKSTWDYAFRRGREVRKTLRNIPISYPPGYGEVHVDFDIDEQNALNNLLQLGRAGPSDEQDASGSEQGPGSPLNMETE